VYHVMSRGNPREDIFLEDADRRDFAPRPRVPKFNWRYYEH
jgi:hypothetical protein